MLVMFCLTPMMFLFSHVATYTMIGIALQSLGSVEVTY